MLTRFVEFVSWVSTTPKTDRDPLGIKRPPEGASKCRFTGNINQTKVKPFINPNYKTAHCTNPTVPSSSTARVSGLVVLASRQAAVSGVRFLLLGLRFSLLVRPRGAVQFCLFYCSSGGGGGGGGGDSGGGRSALCCLRFTVLLGLFAAVQESRPTFEPLFPLARRLLHLSRRRSQEDSYNVHQRSNTLSLVFRGRGSISQILGVFFLCLKFLSFRTLLTSLDKYLIHCAGKKKSHHLMTN